MEVGRRGAMSRTQWATHITPLVAPPAVFPKGGRHRAPSPTTDKGDLQGSSRESTFSRLPSFARTGVHGEGQRQVGKLAGGPHTGRWRGGSVSRTSRVRVEFESKISTREPTKARLVSPSPKAGLLLGTLTHCPWQVARTAGREGVPAINHPLGPYRVYQSTCHGPCTRFLYVYNMSLRVWGRPPPSRLRPSLGGWAFLPLPYPGSTRSPRAPQPVPGMPGAL